MSSLFYERTKFVSHLFRENFGRNEIALETLGSGGGLGQQHSQPTALTLRLFSDKEERNHTEKVAPYMVDYDNNLPTYYS
jgi:hypothetical protein